MSPAAPAPRSTRLTGRAAVLAVVICAIVLSLVNLLLKAIVMPSKDQR